MLKMKGLLVKASPFLFFVILTSLVFRDFIFRGLLPIPADILVGAYYPWLDYKWGYVVGVPVKNPLPSDVISILYPARVLGMEIFRSGNWPLWDPTSLLGTPLFANFQAALLNPVNFLFLILSAPLVWSIQVVLQPIFISLSTYLFLKNLGLRKIAAMFGSTAFAFSGFSLVWMEYNTIGYVLGFFPLAMLLADKIAREVKVKYAFLLGLVLALQIFSGYPQLVIYTVFFSAIYFSFRVFYMREQLISKVAVYGAGIITAVFLAAVQLLPSFELARLSIRSLDTTATGGGIQFLPVQHFVTLFVPDFFGSPATGNFWGLGSYDNFAFFVATPVLYLAILSFLSVSALVRRNIIFLFFMLVSLVLATQNLLSTNLASNDILGLRSAVAARALFIFDFAIAVLAAVELDKLLSGKMTSLFQRFVPLLIYAGIAIGLVLSKVLSQGSFEDTMVIAAKNTVIPLAFITFMTGAFFFTRSKSYLIVVSLGLLVVWTLLSTNKYLTFSPAKFMYPPTEAIKALQENVGVHRFEHEPEEIFPSNVWVPYGLKAASGQNALLPALSAKYFNLINNRALRSYSRYIDIANTGSPLYDTLDIQYLAVLNRDEKTFAADPKGKPLKQFMGPRFTTLGNFGTVRLLENKSNLGPAWFSEKVKCLDNEKLTVEILTEESYNPKQLTVINCSPGQMIKTSETGIVNVSQDLPVYSKLTASTPLENYLVISKVNYPGWKVFVDGTESKLYSANIALMSVPVPAGQHTIELKYQPESFQTGLKVSLVTLGGWILLLSAQSFAGRLKKNVKS